MSTDYNCLKQQSWIKKSVVMIDIKNLMMMKMKEYRAMIIGRKAVKIWKLTWIVIIWAVMEIIMIKSIMVIMIAKEEFLKALLMSNQ